MFASEQRSASPIASAVKVNISIKLIVSTAKVAGTVTIRNILNTQLNSLRINFLRVKSQCLASIARFSCSIAHLKMKLSIINISEALTIRKSVSITCFRIFSVPRQLAFSRIVYLSTIGSLILPRFD